MTTLRGNFAAPIPIARWLVALLGCCPVAAVAQSLDVSQYVHMSWRTHSGFTRGSIIRMAQTRDGYLWLGTEFGLVRFDGVRAVPWQPRVGQRLPDERILALLATHDGSLWIGTSKGLASLKDGALTNYTEVSDAVFTMVEGTNGTVWVARSRPGRICRIEPSAIQCVGEGKLGAVVESMLHDSRGNLWLGTQTGLWKWTPGEPQQFVIPGEVDPPSALVEGDDGSVIIETRHGFKRWVDGKIQEFPLPGITSPFTPSRGSPDQIQLRNAFIRSRDGALWISTSQGVLHVHQTRTDRFTVADGLSSDSLRTFLEDSEGNIWVSTDEGLDRFSTVAASTISMKQGLSSATAWSVQATRDGSVWIGTSIGLDRWENGEVTKTVASGARRLMYTLGLDPQNRLLGSTLNEVVRQDSGRFVPVPSAPSGHVMGIASEQNGTLWISSFDLGLFRMSPNGVVHQIEGTRFTGDNNVRTILPEPARGGAWLGLSGNGGVVHLVDDKVQATYTRSDGLRGGSVSHLRLGSDGALWVSAEGGLSRLKDGRITVLSRRNGLPCDPTHWSLEDNDQSLWIYLACGLVRVERAEWNSWLTDEKRTVRATIFGIEDGVRNRGFGSAFGPVVTESADGRIWFLVGDGVSVFSPRQLSSVPAPPQVHVEEIRSDGATYERTATSHSGLRLPPNPRNLEIAYTATSLRAPEKVRFRFKLEGQDPDWREVVNKRQVEYSNLSPGGYRFHVTAAIADGPWNPEEALLDFDVAPAFYQTRGFVVALVLLGVLVGGGIHYLRLRQVARAMSARFDERLAERVRVAREIHDTFLQTVQGSRMVAEHALKNASDHDGLVRAVGQLSTWLVRATEEGRAALNSLRASTTETNDLMEALRRALVECREANGPETSFTVHGESIDVHPVVRDEIYRIGYEAIRNACTHSGADRVDVTLAYGHELTLRVSDNGTGIDAAIVEKGKDGHFGLRGMRERAERIDGALTLVSHPHSGTVVTLRVPGRIAFHIARPTEKHW